MTSKLRILKAEVSTVQTAAGGQLQKSTVAPPYDMAAASTGHRPAGTAAAAASTVSEATKTTSLAHLESQLEAYHAKAHQLQQLCANIDDDRASDSH